MKSPLFAVLIYLSLPALAISQNMVPNSAFEQFNACPRKAGQLNTAKPWTSPNSLQPDYYHACASPESGFSVPENLHGNFPAHSGFGYVGLPSTPESPGILETKLLQPLEAGQTYTFQAWVLNPSDPGSLPKNLLGFRLSASPFPLGESSKASATFPIPTPSRAGEPWFLLRADFLAQGGERFLRFGILSGSPTEANYFLTDDIRLEPKAAALVFMQDTASLRNPKELQFIPNPYFESYRFCPENREEFNLLDNWITGRNTPDFFHLCAKGTKAGPRNALGFQEPLSGKGFGGFWAYCGTEKDKKEYIRISFPKDLEEKKEYLLTVYLSLADVSEVALQEIQVYFARRKVTIPKYFSLTNGGWMDDKAGWMKLEINYVGNGDETSLTLGNFILDKKLKTKKVVKGNLDYIEPLFRKSAYYYIDNVTLTRPLADPSPLTVTHDPVKPVLPPVPVRDSVPRDFEDSLETGKTFILRNVNFDFDQDKLKKESFAELDKVVAFLRRRPEVKAEVMGHTDQAGGAIYNQRLSERRARSVKEYLQKNGVGEERISSKGFGEDRPLRDPAEPGAAEMNRRVEIRLFE